MKGIILAGGQGNRLKPLTQVTNKHLLPVYDKPMIFYPLTTLLSAGINDILIVTGPQSAGGFLNLLGSGKNFGCRFTFEVQEEAKGIAHALSFAKEFIGQESMAVILGDNIIEDDVTATVRNFKKGAHLFLKELDDPERFGVAEVRHGRVIAIEEKPKKPKSRFAVTGFYLYDADVFKIIKTLHPSARGEYEITDVNNIYVQRNALSYSRLCGRWTDAGTFESLFCANSIARDIAVKNDRVHRTMIKKNQHQRIKK